MDSAECWRALGYSSPVVLLVGCRLGFLVDGRVTASPLLGNAGLSPVALCRGVRCPVVTETWTWRTVQHWLLREAGRTRAARLGGHCQQVRRTFQGVFLTDGTPGADSVPVI